MPPCPFRAINHQLLNPTNPSPTLAPYQPFASFVRLKTAPNRLGFPGRLGMKKETVSRLSVSLPPSLLRQLDQMSGEKGDHNRSLAIADMIRDRLVEHRQKFGSWQKDQLRSQCRVNERMRFNAPLSTLAVCASATDTTSGNATASPASRRRRRELPVNTSEGDITRRTTEGRERTIQEYIADSNIQICE